MVSKHYFGPKNREELIQSLRFYANGTENYPQKYAERIVDACLSDWRDPNSVDDIADINNIIFKNGLLHPRARYGWIDNNGEFLGCGFAAHETLLMHLELDIGQVEDWGWLRISTHMSCKKRPKPIQIKRLRQFEQDNECDLHFHPEDDIIMLFERPHKSDWKLFK